MKNTLKPTAVASGSEQIAQLPHERGRVVLICDAATKRVKDVQPGGGDTGAPQ